MDWSKFVIATNTTNGVVNWDGVKADLTDIADFGLIEKWFWTGKASKAQLTGFLLDFAKVVDAYSH